MTDVDERERCRLAEIKQNRLDAKPIIKELRKAGFDVANGVGELYAKKINYQSAIPILVDWLPKISNPDVKEDIVRALSVKWAKHAAPLLVTEFEQAEDETGIGLRWAIGNALEVLADDAIADDMIRLAQSRQYGRAREMVVMGLGKLKHPDMASILIKLLEDEEVFGNAIIALGRLKSFETRVHIESYLDHPRSWIRRAAKTALEHITIIRLR